MKQIAAFLFSPQLMAVILITFAVSIGTATFIENDFGSASARVFVYNARWFEILLFVGIVNLIGRIIINKLFAWSKITIFLFHFAFALILSGAAVTRYTGFEGSISLREGETSDQILSGKAYIRVKTVSVVNTINHDFGVSFSSLGNNNFTRTLRINGRTFKLRCKSFLSNRVESIPPAKGAKQVSDGINSQYDAVILELSSGNEQQDITLLGKEGIQGIPGQIRQNGIDFIITYGSVQKKIPFKLKLDDFIVARYPGSQSPSSFESHVALYDSISNYTAVKRIYMNNILKYRGYRFYQSSYDPDEKGTVLSVNHDLAGTSLSYLGYFLMGLGMVLSIFNTNSRFRAVSQEIKKLQRSGSIPVLIIIFLVFNGLSYGNDLNTSKITPININHAEAFGKLLLQDNNGRIEPVNTLSSEVLRKLYRKDAYKGLNPDQVFVGMLTDPDNWQYEPVIRVTNPGLRNLLGSGERYFSFASFFSDNHYILQKYIEEAYRKKPAFRSKFDSELIKVDERVNICYLVFSGQFLRIFPVAGDQTHTWYDLLSIRGKLKNQDSLFAENVIYIYIQDVQKSLKSGDWKSPDNILGAIRNYQIRNSDGILPSSQKIAAEIFLNKADVFSRISRYYALIGFALLLLQFVGLFYTKLNLKIPVIIAIILIIIVFIIHSSGLAMRWYVSGHAPWSNGYEALTYVAWATVLAGLIFASKSFITLSVTSVLAFLILFVAHLSFMDPQITNLVPVLKSYWLVIHVATITASYGFLAMGALLAYINLLMMCLHNTKNMLTIRRTIQELTLTIEMALTIGLYLLSIGVFLGAVWANESWGRYWGWDPKETWALVAVLVYAFVLHMRLIPGLKGTYAFNLASLVGLSSVIMTYFGVNYYLSGLHSYAQGDPVPVPHFVYYTAGIILITSLAAYYRSRALVIQRTGN